MGSEGLTMEHEIRIAALEAANQTLAAILRSRYKIQNSHNSITALARVYENYIREGKIGAEQLEAVKP